MKQDSFNLRDLPTELSDILIGEIDSISNEENNTLTYKLKDIVYKASPVDLAKVAHYYSPEIVKIIFSCLKDGEDKAKFLSVSSGKTIDYILNFINESELYNILSLMDADDISDVLEEITDRHLVVKLRKVIDKLDIEKKYEIKSIMSYDENSIARFMSTDFIEIKGVKTVKDAIEEIRKSKDNSIDAIFITSKFGELIGKLSLKELILQPQDRILESSISSTVYRLRASDSRESILSFIEYNYNDGSVPVVDFSGVIVGVLTPSIIAEMMQDITSDTISAIGGSEEHDDEYNIYEKFLSRSPWLLMTLASGMLSATAISIFSSTLDSSILFAICFIPLITGMSGNIGIQSSTVIVRGVAVSGWSYREAKKIIGRESIVGILIGIAFGILVGTTIAIINAIEGSNFTSTSSLQVGCTVGIGLCVSSVWASMIGSLAPVFFSYIGIDPAVSAGPMVTALNDVIAMSIYLSVAKFMPFFF